MMNLTPTRHSNGSNPGGSNPGGPATGWRSLLTRMRARALWLRDLLCFHLPFLRPVLTKTSVGTPVRLLALAGAVVLLAGLVPPTVSIPFASEPERPPGTQALAPAPGEPDCYLDWQVFRLSELDCTNTYMYRRVYAIDPHDWQALGQALLTVFGPIIEANPRNEQNLRTAFDGAWRVRHTSSVCQRSALLDFLRQQAEDRRTAQVIDWTFLTAAKASEQTLVRHASAAADGAAYALDTYLSLAADTAKAGLKLVRDEATVTALVSEFATC